MENQNKGSGFFMGLFLGGVIGIALGFLLAPRPGRETREQLRSRIDELIAQGREILREGKEILHEVTREEESEVP